MSKKLVYVIGSLANKGGGERIITEKMNLLSARGYQVWVITCFQFPETMPNVYTLSDSVKQIYLQIPSYLQFRHRQPVRLWYRWKYQRQLSRELEKTVNAIAPDFLIGVSFSLADVVSRMKCKAVKVIESHNNRQFVKGEYMFRRQSFISKLYNDIWRHCYLRAIDRHADVVVVLTKGDALQWYRAKRVEVIPNFSLFPVTRVSDLSSKRIITAGRLEPQKGFDQLLEIWNIVSRRHPDWQLDIFGEGSLEQQLKRQISQLGIANVSLHPFVSDISSEYADSSVFVLTSIYEGFSLVLLEAFRHGLPCVSYNCPFGPKDIVDNDVNGYLVENGDMKAFAQKICFLIEHPEVRKTFAAKALEKSKMYDQDAIMKQWTSLFDSLCHK